MGKTKSQILDEPKIPKTKDNYVGIEIEFISTMNRYNIRDLLLKHDLHQNCQVKGDGSITPTIKPCPHKHICGSDDFNDWVETCKACTWEDNQYDKWKTHELTVMCKEDDLKEVLNKVNVILKTCKAKVNESCGLHVHIDMRNRDYKKAAANFLSRQEEMRSLVPKTRLKSNYCLPLTKQELALPLSSVPRYRDINVQAFLKFKTIEIRLHEGCVSTREMYSWCKYLIGIADSKKVSMAYVQQRYKKCL